MRSHLLFLTPAIILAGCMTTQENPNYEFSSRYRAPTQIQTAQTVQPMPETVVATPETVTAIYQQPSSTLYDVQVVAEPAPTDQYYAGQAMTGTPGYMAMAEGHAAQTIDVVTTPSPQPVDYDYSQNLIAAEAVMAAPDIAEDVRIIAPGGTDYTVQQGDTIYALSRQHCVGVDVIRGMNEIGADYGIKIGQTLRLPESRC